MCAVRQCECPGKARWRNIPKVGLEMGLAMIGGGSAQGARDIPKFSKVQPHAPLDLDLRRVERARHAPPGSNHYYPPDERAG
jgi:hypothetical protein